MKQKKNLHLISSLFEANEEKSISIKTCWKGENLLSQKRDIANLEKNLFITPKR